MMKLKVEIKGLKVYCEKLGKEVMVDIGKCDWSGGEWDCDLCGSHGRVSVGFKCECGKSHEVELRGW